jgi:lysophospholipase L1-like esterase
MRILCIGDSNTWGYDPLTGLRQDNRWTKLLSKKREQDEIIEEGLNSRTFCFDDPFNEGRNGLAVLPMILTSAQPVDLVIVMLGTNDLKTLYHAHAGYIAKGAKRFVETIQNPYIYKYPVPKILLMAPVHLGDAAGAEESDFDAESVRQSKILAFKIEEIANEYQVPFLDAAKYAKAYEEEGIHLDGQAHAALAQAVDEKIAEIFA